MKERKSETAENRDTKENDEQTLDTMLYDYRQNRISRKDLEGLIFMYINAHPRRFFLPGWKDSDDFTSWMYPRLSRAVDRYTDQGSSFDNYITALVKLSAREYGRRKKEHWIIENTWWNTKAAEETMISEPEEPEYLCRQPEPQKVSNPRQVLMLMLKSYHYLSDAYISRLAPALGMEPGELYHMVDEMRILRLRREEVINGLKERIHGQFYRCLAFEKRLQAAVPSSAHWYKIQGCLERARKRLASMRRRLGTMRIDASNGEVARIMGIAKGTVDSSLYAVKQRNQTENQ